MNLNDNDFWSRLKQGIWSQTSSWLLEARNQEGSQKASRPYAFWITEFPANLIMIPTCPNDDMGRGEVPSHLNGEESRRMEAIWDSHRALSTEFEEEGEEKKYIIGRDGTVLAGRGSIWVRTELHSRSLMKTSRISPVGRFSTPGLSQDKKNHASLTGLKEQPFWLEARMSKHYSELNSEIGVMRSLSFQP